MTVPLSQQIAEVRRELGKRKTVYPRLIAKGSMRRGEAEHATVAMQSVLKTLEWLQVNEPEIRAAMQREKAGQ
jgi:hypothetical protein